LLTSHAEPPGKPGGFVLCAWDAHAWGEGKSHILSPEITGGLKEEPSGYPSDRIFDQAAAIAGKAGKGAVKI